MEREKRHGGMFGPASTQAAIYEPEVCEVCLNCPYEKCRAAGTGCAAFKERFREVVRQGTHFRPSNKK